MNYHDDYLIFFTLSRTANNHKVINKIFYIILKGWNTNNTKIKFRIKEKVKNKEYMRCNSLLNFIEFLFYKTENTFKDKKFAFYSLNRWFLSYWCRNYTGTLSKAINISKLFLNNKYIDESDKKNISDFLKDFNYSQ